MTTLLLWVNGNAVKLLAASNKNEKHAKSCIFLYFLEETRAMKGEICGFKQSSEKIKMGNCGSRPAVTYAFVVITSSQASHNKSPVLVLNVPVIKCDA